MFFDTFVRIHWHDKSLAPRGIHADVQRLIGQPSTCSVAAVKNGFVRRVQPGKSPARRFHISSVNYLLSNGRMNINIGFFDVNSRVPWLIHGYIDRVALFQQQIYKEMDYTSKDDRDLYQETVSPVMRDTRARLMNNDVSG